MTENKQSLFNINDFITKKDFLDNSTPSLKTINNNSVGKSLIEMDKILNNVPSSSISSTPIPVENTGEISPSLKNILNSYNIKPPVDSSPVVDEPSEKDKSWSEDDLRKDKGWINNAKTIYKYQKGKDFEGTDKEVASWLLNRHTRLGNNFTNLGLTAAQADNMDEDVKNAWVDSIEKYENSDWTLRGFFKGAFWSVADLPTLLSGGSLLLAKQLGGKYATAVAKHSFKEMLKKNLKDKTIKEGGRKLSKPQIAEVSKQTGKEVAKRQAKTGAVIGPAYSGLYDVMYQDYKGKIDEEYEYNPYNTGIALAFGLGFGTAAPVGFTRAGEKLFRNKRVEKAFANPDEYTREIKLKDADVFDTDEENFLAKQQKEGVTAPNKNTDTQDILSALVAQKKVETNGKKLKILTEGSGEYKEKANQTDLGNDIDDGGILQKDKRGRNIKVNYKAIPEKKYLEKILPKDTEIKAKDLAPVEENAPKGQFALDSEVGQADFDVVLGANFLGQLNPAQAKVQIEKMADSVNAGGDLVVNVGKRKQGKPISETIITKGDKTLRTGESKKPGEKSKDFTEEITEQDTVLAKEEIGVNSKQVKALLEDNFEEVKPVSWDKKKKTYVDDKNSDIFIARRRYTVDANLLGNENLTNKDFTFKKLFSFGPKINKDKIKLNFTQSAGLPKEISEAIKVANRLTETIKPKIRRKIKVFNTAVRETIETVGDGRKWKDMTPKERDYVNHITTQIFRGKNKYISPDGDKKYSRLDYVKGKDKTLRNADFDDLNADPIESISPRVIKAIEDLRKDITTLQKKAIKEGLIEKNTPLLASFKKSMGEGTTVDNIDLHVHRQYRIIDDKGWRKTLKKFYPERIARAKEYFKSDLNNDTELAEFSNSIKNYQDLKPYFKEIILLDETKPKDAKRIAEILNAKEVKSKGINNVQDFQAKFVKSEEDSLDELVNSFLDKYSPEEVSFLRNKGDFNNIKPDADIFTSPSAKIRNTFYKRGKVPSPLRSLMGEYQNVEDNYVQTYYKLAQNVANYKMEKDIQRILNNSINPETMESSLFPNVKFIRKEGDVSVAAPEGYASLTDATRLPQFTKGINVPLREIDPKFQQKPTELYVPEVIADAIKNGNDVKPLQADGFLGNAWRFLIGAQAYSRLAVTALRLSAYPRNFAGAGIKSLANGNLSAEAVREANKVFKVLKGFDDPKFNSLFMKLTDLGLVGQSTRAADIRSAFNEAADNPLRLWTMDSLTNTQGLKDNPVKSVKGFLDKSQQYLLDRYQLMDDYWKVYTWVAERNKYREVLLDDPEILGTYKIGQDKIANFNGKKVGDVISPDDIKRGFDSDELDVAKGKYKKVTVSYLDDYASQVVARHMDNYGELSRFLKSTRRFPVADFLSYKAEQVRTTWNTLEDALYDIKRGIQLQSESGGTRGGAQYMVGLKRLGSIIATFGINSSMPAAITYFTLREGYEENGSDTIKIDGKLYENPVTVDQAMKDISRADYQKGAAFVPLGKQRKDGTYSALDYNRINPFAPLQENFSIIMQAFEQGGLSLSEKLSETMKTTMVRLYEELGPSMVLKALINVSQGRDEFGRPLSNAYEDQEASTKATAYLKEAGKVLVPGIGRDINSLRKVLKKTEGKTFFKYKDIEGEERRESRSAGGFRKKPVDEVYKAVGIPIVDVQPLESMPFKFANSLKTIQNSSKIFLDELVTDETLDVNRIVDAYRKALLEEKKGYNDLSFGLIKAKRIMSNEEITRSLTLNKSDPSKFNTYFKKILKLPSKYKVSDGLQPNSKQIDTRLRKIRYNRRGKNYPKEFDQIRPLLKEVYNSINGSEYSYVSKLKPKEKD